MKFSIRSMPVTFAFLSLILSAGAQAAVSGSGAELAKVNGKVITSKDVHTALGGMNEGQQSSYLRDVAARRQVLQALIDQELLIEQAEREKLDQDAEVKEAIALYKKRLLTERLISKNVDTKITESAAKKYYEANKSLFGLDQVHVQHILVETEAQANALLGKAKEPGTDFQELAEKNSKDTSAKNNRGDIGWIPRDAPLAEAFKDAAFRTKEGEIVGPVRTDYGYHVIKVVGKKFGRALGYDEVEVRVKEKMRSELVQSYLGQLKRQAKISIDEKALDKM